MRAQITSSVEKLKYRHDKLGGGSDFCHVITFRILYPNSEYSYNPDKCHVYPTIGELVITHYIDENYRDMFAGEVVLGARTDQQKRYAKLYAGKIARLCDHYKTR